MRGVPAHLHRRDAGFGDDGELCMRWPHVHWDNLSQWIVRLNMNSPDARLIRSLSRNHPRLSQLPNVPLSRALCDAAFFGDAGCSNRGVAHDDVEHLLLTRSERQGPLYPVICYDIYLDICPDICRGIYHQALPEGVIPVEDELCPTGNLDVFHLDARFVALVLDALDAGSLRLDVARFVKRLGEKLVPRDGRGVLSGQVRFGVLPLYEPAGAYDLYRIVE